ncbi:uncharacterized protein EI90DRAFT_3057973, partial [Cantharellus anzutake]
MKFFHTTFIASSLLFLLTSLTSIHSAFAFTTGMKVPTYTLRPGHVFNVTFFTLAYIRPSAQYFVIFGLQPGTGPLTGGNIGQFVLTSSHSDWLESGDSVTGSGHFDVDVALPVHFRTPRGRTQKYRLTAAIFQSVNLTGFDQIASILKFSDFVTIA